jgi:uncharacterized protein YciI
MKKLPAILILATLGAFPPSGSRAEDAKAPAAGFDAALARQVGADEHGMRSYVLVILKTGPTPLPKGEKRNEMFKGHFANMERLASAGKLAVAGPFDGVDGWRGMFVFAVKDIEEAKALTETDPVIANGEMVAEYHKLFSSAALMLVNETHKKIAKQSF